MTDLSFQVGGHALQAANGNRLVSFQPPAPAGRFAGAVAGSAQNAGEDVGLPVQHIAFGIFPLGNQADVFRDVGVGRACPLAIDNFMEVVGIFGVGRFHALIYFLHPTGRFLSAPYGSKFSLPACFFG